MQLTYIECGPKCKAPGGLRGIMIALVLVFAVIVLGWLMAAFAFVAISISMIPRFREHSSVLRDSSADAKFLHDVGIRP